MRLTWLFSITVGCGLQSAVDPEASSATSSAETNTSASDSGVSSSEEGWCGVQGLLNRECVTCHSTTAALGDLDLQSSPYETLLTQPSVYGGQLVVPGKPRASVLLRKLRGDEAVGGVMPPTGALSVARVAEVEAWIAEGASDACSKTVGDTKPVTYHPMGWADPDHHGLAAKLGEDDCLSCHGEDLAGGDVGVSCASCHDAVVADWTRSCTFCHGDPGEGSGAPPRDIDGTSDPAAISFPAHRVHLSSSLHADWDCAQCHRTPTDVFTAGHVFVDDATPAVADLDFAASLSPGTTYDGLTCTNAYCHGNGRSTGTVDIGASVTCGDCHPVQSTPSRWGALSAPHEDHLDEDIPCATCHPTVDDAGSLVDKVPHIDGQPTVHLTGLTRGSDGRCTGSCHDENHNGRDWQAD